MQKDLKILGLIGIRSGSKSIPDKNIKPLLGRPLVAWIIDTAKKSKYLNRVIVSTDSSEYAGIANGCGAETPFLRPKEFAGDKSTDLDYVKHAVNWLRENENYKPDIVVRMMATVPLQSAGDIDGCIEELIKDTEAHSSVVIAEASQHPHKALKLINDGKGGEYLVSYITGTGRDVTPGLRQGYEKAYFRGNVVACRTNVINEMDSLTGDKVRYHIIPQARAIDIDSPVDFEIAEFMLKKITKNDTKLS